MVKFRVTLTDGTKKILKSNDKQKIADYVKDNLLNIKEVVQIKDTDKDDDNNFYVLYLYKSDEHELDKNGDIWGYIEIAISYGYHIPVASIWLPFNDSTKQVCFDKNHPWNFIREDSKKWKPEVIELLKENSNKLNNFLKSRKLEDHIEIKE